MKVVAKVKVVSNKDLILNATQEQIDRALEAIGLQAEGYAQMKCPVDTGLLRNSITHAVAGQAPAKSSYSDNGVHADTPATRRAGTAGLPTEHKTGTYSGNTPQMGFLFKKNAVYIGTNVKYAPYVEYGTRKTSAQPFLKPAVEDHIDEYRNMCEYFLST